MSTINLGACENLLKNYYNFSSNQTLYMKKIELVVIVMIYDIK